MTIRGNTTTYWGSPLMTRRGEGNTTYCGVQSITIRDGVTLHLGGQVNVTVHSMH